MYLPFFSRSSAKSQAGYTLVEMMVVVAIIGLISTVIITNFSRTRVDLTQSANLIASTVRFAQSETISSSKFQNYNPCGYGIHYINSADFALYAGPNAATTDCKSINRNYQSNEDSIVKTYVFSDPNVDFAAPFNDIYFEPPDPKTYLNNDSSLNQGPLTISIGVVGGSCPQNCKTINVYPSGTVQIQ